MTRWILLRSRNSSNMAGLLFDTLVSRCRRSKLDIHLSSNRTSTKHNSNSIPFLLPGYFARSSEHGPV
ncbi:hypothetical protein T01_2525 [Trichinella spiralis]|uniref:Uncharacterized protein n=1 Tax=Trichinella spiralis TaxID=6334 RepID=A0A0V0Z069_TRISP|nr:hypothetical protein T01_2525 [Trichinella spiralis]